MDREKILDDYRDIVGIDSVRARRLIKKVNYKEDYYLLQCIV